MQSVDFNKYNFAFCQNKIKFHIGSVFIWLLWICNVG